MDRIDEIIEALGCDRAPIVGPREVVGLVVEANGEMTLTIADGSRWVAPASTCDAFGRALRLKFRVGHYTRRAIAGRVEFREAGR